jgi:hypothetical protein
VSILRGLDQIPLRGRGIKPQGGVRPGVATELEPLLNGRYSLDYLTWQIGRCPALSCYTCMAPKADAGILLWTPPAGIGFWRMAPVFRENSGDGLRTALALAIRHVYESRGLRISVLVSHRDEQLLRAVEESGFRAARERRMMNVLARPALVQSAEEPAAVSFLDSDMAYRF